MRGFNQLEGTAKICSGNMNIFTGASIFDLVSIREEGINGANFRFCAEVKFCSPELFWAR